jgi:hypothetical protein
MVVSTPSGSGITLSSTAGATTISSTGGGELTIGGSVSATAFTGGIAMAIGVLTFPVLDPDAAGDPVDVEIANFLGTNTSAYVISNNSQGLIQLTIAYVSNTETSTTVAITAFNLATVAFSGNVSYSIIAMN